MRYRAVVGLLTVTFVLAACGGEQATGARGDAAAVEEAVDVAAPDVAEEPPPPDVAAPDAGGDTPSLPPPDDVPGPDDVPAAEDVAAPDDVAVPADAPRDASVDAAPDAPADAPAPRRDPPAPRAYSRGRCPTLRGSPTNDGSLNTGFRTGSQTREFRLIVPRNYDGRGEWPLVFAWHWLNASASSFVRTGELETAAEQMRFIAVVPEALRNSNGDRTYVFSWPFAEFWGIPAEVTFFDDMLACVTEQFRVDRRRVHGVGVSAGALWVTYLSTTDRANYFASVESLSGGLGEVPIAWRIEYRPQANKFPAMVLWGGPSDWLGLSFEQASTRYRDELLRDNHFVMQCVHDMGHMVPPVDPPPGGGTRFRMLWQFFLDHPYGLAPGDSPYLRTGLPAGTPSWCSIPRRPGG